MNDLPSAVLLQQSNARPIGGEDLEVMGKEAAARFVDGRCDSLNTAVVETIKHAGLSPEQVKRVVEFANTDAYLQEFRKEGQHKVVEFDGGPANYADILKDLNDGGGGTVFDTGSSDYDLPPPSSEKTASAVRDRMGFEDPKLAAAFSVQETPIPYAEPLQDSLLLQEKLAKVYDNVSERLSMLETHYLDVTDRLYEQVKQASLDGATLGQIVAAWSTITDEPTFMKIAFEKMTPRLLDGQVFASKGAIGESLTKTACSGIVNAAHPLVHTYGEFCETLVKMAESRKAQGEVSESLDKIATFLKMATRSGALQKAWQFAGEATGKAAPYAERAAGAVAGPKAGELAGKAVGKSHYLIPALAAEQVYREAKTGKGPIGGPTKFVAGRIPGTRAALTRQYRMIQG
jgi:hypothetical protein